MLASHVARDVRYALRSIVRNPGFAGIALLTFAVGIGVNTAVFSVFDGVLLRPLPYPDADRITMMWVDNRQQGIREDIGSYPTYLDWRDQNTTYAHVGAFTGASFTLTGAGDPERIRGALTTAGFHDVMGLQPVLGRLYTEAEEQDGRDDVVLLSYGLWQRQFGGAPDVLGRTMTLSGVPHEIIGVMPATLRVPDDAQVWKPLAPSEEMRGERGAFWLAMIGRLKPGVPVEQAQTEIGGLAARLEQEYPVQAGFGAYIVPLHRHIVGDVERSLAVLMAAVGCVLLIACANIGNLMLGRTAARRKELAIRTALGARRARLMGQIVTETLVLAVLGSALGLLLAFWATEFFIRVGGDAIPRADAIAIDGRVLLFTLALAVVAALLAGIAPAVQGSRPPVQEQLQEGGREGRGTASRRTRGALVAAEMALAFMLLAGAGVLVRTLWSMQTVDRGFDTDRIAVMTVSLPSAVFAGPPEVRSFYARLLERVRALPGVESAATATGVLLPLLANSGIYSIEGIPDPPPGQRIEYPTEIVSPGFFETLGITLAAGRSFDSRDHAEAPRAVIVNETFARLAWGDRDPIGRRIKPGTADSEQPWMTVVGVIDDVRRGELKRPIRPEIYLSTLQITPRTQRVLVRTGDPLGGHRERAARSPGTCTGAAAVRHRHARRRGVEDADAAAVPRRAAGGVRGDRAAAGEHRDLRCHVARRQPAHAGGRGPDGARRAAGRCAPPHPRTAPASGAPWRGASGCPAPSCSRAFWTVWSTACRPPTRRRSPRWACCCSRWPWRPAGSRRGARPGWMRWSRSGTGNAARRTAAAVHRGAIYYSRTRSARAYSRENPALCAFSCDFDPGCVVTTARSQSRRAASASRWRSSAVWTPARRCAGTVAAPASCAIPSWSRRLAPPATAPPRRAR